MKQIDILVPCYNEEAVLPQFYQRTCAVIDALPDYAFTFIFVNDGSRDQTLPILRQLHEKDKRVAYVSLSRNFGKEAAMLAGMDYAEGDALVIMDADLQDPPELLPDMIAWWEKSYHDVSARRRRREGETFFKKWSSHVYYRLLKKLSPVPVQEDVGDFRLLDRRCVKALRSLRECQRYTKGLFSWIGFEKKEILFDRPPRAAGKTKWNYWKLFNLAIVAAIYLVFIVLRTLLFGEDVPGYPSLISLILFIGGVQFTFMGILGEYVGRIYNESKGRPPYIVGESTKEKK